MLVQTISALDDLRISLFLVEEHCLLEEGLIKDPWLLLFEKIRCVLFQSSPVFSMLVKTISALDDLYFYS